jgi:hypothetical protein
VIHADDYLRVVLNLHLQASTLESRLVISLAERARQVNAFKQASSTVEKNLQADWQAQINAWLADDSKPNPYILDKSGAPNVLFLDEN